jgi:hypothetical protein
MTWRRCSSTYRLARPHRTTASAAEATGGALTSRECVHEPYEERHERAKRLTIERLIAAWMKASQHCTMVDARSTRIASRT